MFQTILLTILEQGLIYAVLALGVYITYKVLNFPDLTVDGSFPLGAVVAAMSLIQGLPPLLVLLLAFIAGALAGLLTGLIHVYAKVSDLLSGILVMTMLYTVNLLLAGTKANVSLLDQNTIYTGALAQLGQSFGLSAQLSAILISLLILLVVKFLLDAFLRSELGTVLRACGYHPDLITATARHPGHFKIMGLMLSNALVALSGAMLAQQQELFEINMGLGSLVFGLASVILGLSIFRKISLLRGTTMVILGSILYKALIAAAIYFSSAHYLRLFQGLFFLIILVLSHALANKGGRHA